MRRAITVAVLALALLGASVGEAEESCGEFRVTGYASEQYPGFTADGTRTLGNEWTIVAVDPAVIPLGSTVWIEGLGEFRAADTGAGVLGRHLDVLTYTVAEAYALTGTYRACW